MIERRIKKFRTAKELAENLAIKIRDELEKKKILEDNLYLALSGGNTPKQLFNILSESPYCEEIQWNNLHLFWGDERCVPPDDSESNFGTAKKLLFDKISIPEKNVHRIRGESIPEKEAFIYTKEIKKFVTLENNLPRFNCFFLGLGEDGHTASLFPGKNLYAVAEGICGVAEKPNPGGGLTQKRISLTRETICNAEQILFLVTGIEKSEILSEIVKEKTGSSRYPASQISNIYGYSEWWIDDEAGSKL